MLIAQAVLALPAILLLDEGLKHLHPTARANLRRELTRAAILEGAVMSEAVSSIVVIEDGVIAQHGTHDQLMRRGGRYAR